MKALLVAAALWPLSSLGEAPVRVEPRLLLKASRVFGTAGVNYLARGDFFTNPGATLAAAYYLSERDGLELKLAWFFSSLSGTGREVLAETGLVPDAQRPQAGAWLGYRRTFGYGKLLAGGSLSNVIHFDLQGTVGGGVVLTDRSYPTDSDLDSADWRVTPSLCAGPGVLARLSPAWFLQLDVSVVASLESRRRASPIALGVLPMLTAGVSL